MNLGIMARTFVRPSLGEVLDAVAAHGLRHVQLNLSCHGLPTLPDAFPEERLREVRGALASRGIEMSALSATFNLIHPDVAQRQVGLQRLGVLAAAAPALGTRILTLCTGTRDPEDMWRGHPDNTSAAAWDDLLRSVEIALELVAPHDLVLGVEPEVSNVVDSAEKARRLLDSFQSRQLGIVMDPANLFHAGELPDMRGVLDRAFSLLGWDIVLAHAKDLTRDGEAGHEAAGSGVLDYDTYLRLLMSHGFQGSLIVHGLREDQVPGSLAFLRDKLDRAGPIVVSH